MDHWIIYLYTNTVNSKKYVGLTKRGLSKRNFDHIKKAREGKGNAFHAAIRKYGMESFTLEALCCCRTIEDARYTEEQMIKCYNSFIKDDGYNMTHGGEARHFTKEEIERIRQRMLGDRNPMKRPEVAKASGAKKKGIPSKSKGKKIEKLSGKNNPFYGKRHPQEIINKTAEISRKTYAVTYDDGRVDIIKNLKEFCENIGVSYSSMRHRIGGKRFNRMKFRIDLYEFA